MMTRSTSAQRTAKVGAAVWIASLTAGVLTSGMQGIVPAIPAIREHFNLDNFEVGLITSVYLLPGLISAFAAGLLTQRIGDRAVVVGGLVLFGLGGVVLLVTHGLATLLIIRFIQGIVFGGLLSMTVGIIGAVAPTGRAAHRGQSRRIVAMAAAEALFPIAGGLMLALAWYAPFATQILALPLAFFAWLYLPDSTVRRESGTKREAAASVWKAPAIIGVQVLAAARFIFKFAVLTYTPVLAVDQVGMSAALLGQLVGVSSALAAITALLSERLAHRLRSSEMILACMLVIAISLSLIGCAGSGIVVAIGLLLYGAQDGVYGVAHNVLANEMAPVDARMAYVGLTGTVRNAGKFLAPLAFGATTLGLSISATFFVFAGGSVVGAGVAWQVARQQKAAGSDTVHAAGSRSESPDPE